MPRIQVDKITKNLRDLTVIRKLNKEGYSLNLQHVTSISGDLLLFNPSSTTFVTHFMSGVSSMNLDGDNRYSVQSFIAGYCNVTAAIDAVQFSFTSGAIASGIIKLYGIKDS